MPRLFVALDLPEETRDALVALQTGLSFARWSKPAQLHMTLRFLGETSADQLPELDKMLERLQQPAIDLYISGLGTFSRDGIPYVLYANVEPAPALMEFQARIEEAVGAMGFDVEPKPFRPHITLARLRDAQPDAVANYVAHASLEGSFTPPSFSLYQSTLDVEGAMYRKVNTYHW